MQNDKWTLHKTHETTTYHTPPHTNTLCIQKGQKEHTEGQTNFHQYPINYLNTYLKEP